MADTKMTYREFYTKVSEVEGIAPELVEFATKAIEALNRKNENRKNGTSKSAVETKALRDNIVEYMKQDTEKIYTAVEIAKALNVTTQKITGNMKQMCESGVVSVQDYSPTGKKKDTVKGYTIND